MEQSAWNIAPPRERQTDGELPGASCAFRWSAVWEAVTHPPTCAFCLEPVFPLLPVCPHCRQRRDGRTPMPAWMSAPLAVLVGLAQTGLAWAAMQFWIMPAAAQQGAPPVGVAAFFALGLCGSLTLIAGVLQAIVHWITGP
jgi:hypothetical protein